MSQESNLHEDKFDPEIINDNEFYPSCKNFD